MADNGMMYGNSLLYQAIMMMVLCIIFVAVWSRCGNRSILEELNVPLLESSPEHRIDAATREAEAGYTKCPACFFENFRRFKNCTICGEKLASPGEGESTSSVSTPSSGRTPRGPSTRHLRARKRKQWTRKLGEDANFVWERKVFGDEPSSVFAIPSLVLEFKQREKEDPQNGVEAVEDALLYEASDRDMILTEASIADAARFPTGYVFTSDKDRRLELNRLATLDFPSKYAHFVVTTASQVVPAEVEFLKLSVHRDYVLEESVDHLCCIQEKHIKSVMRINFLDESAVDAGGVHREWILLLNEVLGDSQLNLFPCRNRVDQSHFLNPNSLHEASVDHLKYYYATGRLIGRVLLEGSLWGFHLSLPLLKIILGQPVGFDDLEYLDPEVYRNLRWLLENNGVESLGLDFSVCENTSDGQSIVVDLVPNGRDIAVTDDNKAHFVERKFRYLVFESVSSQLYALLKGVYEVIPQELLMLYDVEELDYLLCGTDEIDVEDWKAHTNHTMNLNGTRVKDWFWDEVANMPNEYRRRLLLFATGSSRVPLSGFRGLTSYDGRLCPFTLKGVSSSSEKYITSHACFNRLDLPLYRSRRELKTVLYAILEGDVLGFTTA